MAPALLITGASGFVGRRLLRRLDTTAYSRIVCLSRAARPSSERGIEWIHGDLLEPGGWTHAIGADTVVLHLAAATGNVAAAEHERVNARGTALLLAACRAAGALGLLFVSSIAAAYARTRDYPYARSKREAEDAVRASGLAFAIARPTVVLGADSPIGRRFRQLASRRVIPLIAGGRARIQPIDVDDLADCLIELAAPERIEGQTWTLGGPEALTIAELLTRLYRREHGGDPVVVSIPHGPVRAALSLAGRLSNGRLPITAGQLSLFVNDGLAEPNELLRHRWPAMKDVDAMLASLTESDA